VSRPVDIVFLGHVDHGKSTLIARLLIDTETIGAARLDEVIAASKRRGAPLEISYLLDALQIERDQAITVDASRIWFAAGGKRYAIIDAPGHEQFVKSMVSGSSDASFAVLLIDASEGVLEQTRRHLALLAPLNIRRIVAVVNKMDVVDFDAAAFERVASAVKELCAQRGVACDGPIPVVARDGDNVVRVSTRMPWYTGPTLLDVMASFEPAPELYEFRLPVQDIYRQDNRRVLVGTAQGSDVGVGDMISILPAGFTAKIKEILRFPIDGRPIRDGDAIGIVLDRQAFVEPGDVVSAPDKAPAAASTLNATIFWLDAQPLQRGDMVGLRVGTRDVDAIVSTIKHRLEIATWDDVAADSVGLNDIAQLDFTTASPIPVDAAVGSVLSRLAIYRQGRICGGGVIDGVGSDTVTSQRRSANIVPPRPRISSKRLSHRFGHTGGVVWLTGLPGSGKTTIAQALEGRLFDAGWNACVLDGDALRDGLNGDLGFSFADRKENVRRVGAVANLFAENGFIAIVALVSAHAADRQEAREAAGEIGFHEIYVSAPVAVCAQRDPKGHYARAMSGEMADFTGVSSPYESPANPDLTLDTSTETIERSVAHVYELVVGAHASREG
jgi:bifunctional enzyme CysN/CysC